MAYTTNQYNYATPLSSAPGFVNEVPVTSRKYFSLSDNRLDGSYVPVSGDAGLWGTSIADANGVLSVPFVVTITETATIGAFRLVGSDHNHPVAFTVKFYNGNTLLRTITESANASAAYVYHMTPALSITHYEITVTKISIANGVAQLYNVYEPATGSHKDTFKAKTSESSGLSLLSELRSSDSLFVKQSEVQQPVTSMLLRADTAKIKTTEADTIVASIVATDALKAKESSKTSIVNTIDVIADSLRVKQTNGSHILNTIDVTKDPLVTRFTEARTHILNTIDVMHDTANIKASEVDTIVANIAATDTLKAKESSKTSIVNTIDVAKDALRVVQTTGSHILNTIDVTKDSLVTKIVEARTHVLNTIDVTHDKLNVLNIDVPTLTNVHTRMKEPSRRVYGKVYITYTDPMLDNETVITASGGAYNSEKDQVSDTVHDNQVKYFTLYDNKLDGTYLLSDENSQVGWVSKAVSGADGTFDEPQFVQINFAARPIVGLPIYFDTSHGAVAEDFIVEYIKLDGTKVSRTFTGNTEQMVVVTNEAIANVVAIKVTVTKVSKPYYPAAILELPVISTILYKGYKDASDIVSIDLLEELSYKDEIEALGGISANEITVVLDNSDKQFYFNNTESPVSQQLKRNRKIVPWLGVEIIPGEIEWYTLGTFWSYNWNVPVGSLTATVVGFDTIGLLGTTSFTDHQMLIGQTLGQLIEYVLEDARITFDFIEYEIDDGLYNVVIPYAWFEPASHTAALQKISECYPMHIYCDRNGKICAVPQKLKLDFYYDTWADNTNVISKTYDSLYTTLPNVVNVTVHDPVVKDDEQLAQDQLVFNVAEFPTRTLNFSNPYISNLQVMIDCDNTVKYTYKVYSWGIEFEFFGTGMVRSIECRGTVLDTSTSSVITRKDEASIRLNGSVARDVSSDFIQNSTLASLILNRIFSLSEADKYDATVDYRGDISLTINDPIRLLNGIAPDNRYNIKRHQLFWNGALSGSAELNT